jgi:hypothetical protein
MKDRRKKDMSTRTRYLKNSRRKKKNTGMNEG